MVLGSPDRGSGTRVFVQGLKAEDLGLNSFIAFKASVCRSYDGPSIYFFSLLVDPEVLRRGFFGIQNRSGH